MSSSFERNQSLFPDVSKLNETPVVAPIFITNWDRQIEIQHAIRDNERIVKGLGIIATGSELPSEDTETEELPISTDKIIIKSVN